MGVLFAVRDTNITLLSAPPGTQPNFVNPPTRGGEMVGASIAVTTLALIFVLARIYTKLFITKGFDWADYFAISAMVSLSFYT